MTPLVRVADPVVQALRAKAAKPVAHSFAKNCFMEPKDLAGEGLCVKMIPRSCDASLCLQPVPHAADNVYELVLSLLATG